MLSAALIVKDEEKHLDACLRSVRPLVDEIVIVDTGSQDRSKEIARRFGARVYDFAWNADFAAARNEALRLVSGDWVLYIDADERVRASSRESLDALLTEHSLIGLYVLLHAHPGFTPYRELRLFRNDPLIRFQGVIHENIWPGIRRRSEAKGGQIGTSDLILDHVGYEGNQNHKHQRNLPLLLESLKHDPERIFNWCHLAGVYNALGEKALAERAWAQGVEVARRKSDVKMGHSFPYLGLIGHRMASGVDVRELLEEASRKFPGNMQLLWFEGRYQMQVGDYHRAVAIFERLIEHGTKQDFDLWVGYDQRLFDLYAYDSLATCHFRLGHYDKGETFYGLASQRDPGNREYRAKRQLCARLHRD